jgi:hypothetical protein
MMDLKIGEEIWIISFEVENDFYLLSKQTVTELMEDHIECEDDFNTFHVAYDDVYKTELEALAVMIDRLQQLHKELQ